MPQPRHIFVKYDRLPATGDPTSTPQITNTTITKPRTMVGEITKTDTDDPEMITSWWSRHPPIRNWDRDSDQTHEMARTGGMPLTIGVFNRIPEDEDYIPYYIWLTTWPTAVSIYRASDKAVAIHRLTIMSGLRRYSATPTTATATTVIAEWRPLIELNSAPPFEETLIGVRNRRTIRLSATDLANFLRIYFATPLPTVQRLVMNPAIRSKIQTWITDVLIPWRSSDESDSTAATLRAQFTELYNTVVLPEWTAAAAAVYAAATERLDPIREELTAVAWSPERIKNWCLSTEESEEVDRRWPQPLLQPQLHTSDTS